MEKVAYQCEMRIFVITHPEFISNEAETLISLLENGVSYIYIKKRTSDFLKYQKLLQQIPTNLLSKIIVQKSMDSPNLKTKIHLNSLEYNNSTDKGFSTSFHDYSTFAMESKKKRFEYAYLSTFFGSISKKEYQNDLDLKNIVKKSDTSERKKMIALGGIDDTNIGWVKDNGFENIAILGHIWHSGGNPISQLEKIKNKLQK